MAWDRGDGSGISHVAGFSANYHLPRSKTTPSHLPLPYSTRLLNFFSLFKIYFFTRFVREFFFFVEIHGKPNSVIIMMMMITIKWMYL